ncbi:MAG: tRNA (N6-isopentenyl adenosine(37)-C2)-methylthiotransferase MiaB [Clostridiales bacterium]|nr:tRNA (N6-isopentenyl adenosine(37)-C2)-methylthiotransferase MiaB [Clostridiales bacterium]
MAIIKTTVNDKLDFDAAVTELKEYFSSLGARKGRQLTYNVLTYGCQLNESDSEKLSGMLASMGLKASSGGELDDADVIVFNTCSIRENADRHLFGNLGVFKTLKKNDRDVVIAVGGCMMKVPENVERIKKSYPYVDLVFDPQQLHRFPMLMRDAIRKDKQLVNISADDYIAEDNFFPIDRKRKFRALVPIMYGCNNFCTYCIVPYARGRERSRDFNEIVKELSELASQGYKEVMLLGQNVNSYKGAGGETFADILRAASDFKEFSRVRFMSSHPKDLSDEVIDIMASRPNVEKHLHLAMQSGSNKVLKAMNRPYTIERFQEIVDKFRAKVEGGSLTTDIIVGFPGETDEDFEETLVAVDKAKFDACFTFQYSARPGTKAAAYENQVPSDVVTERFGRLTEYTNRYAEESNKKLVGKTMEVLIEGISKAGDMTFSGRTVTNHLVNFTIPEELGIDPGEDYLEGRLCEVRIDRARPYSVDGILVSLKGEEA